MANVVRNYTMPAALVARIDDVPRSRSETVRNAVLEAWSRPHALVEALRRRIDAVPSRDEVTLRIGVACTDDFLAGLQGLTEMTRLPVEHVLRLAIEAYLSP